MSHLTLAPKNNVTFQELIGEVAAMFDDIQLDVFNSKRGVVFNFDDQYSVTLVDATRTPYNQGGVGIHAREVDAHHLCDLIQQAERDGFDCIYIHSIEGV